MTLDDRLALLRVPEDVRNIARARMTEIILRMARGRLSLDEARVAVLAIADRQLADLDRKDPRLAELALEPFNRVFDEAAEAARMVLEMFEWPQAPFLDFPDAPAPSGP